eukprot:6290906-Alexandrium_andersonii.AAC.1
MASCRWLRDARAVACHLEDFGYAVEYSATLHASACLLANLSSHAAASGRSPEDTSADAAS